MTSWTQAITMAIVGVLGIVLVSFVATVVYVFRNPDIAARLTTFADQLSVPDPHPAGEPCPRRPECPRCDDYDRELRRKTWAAIRAIAQLGFMLPAAAVYTYGPRLGRWLLRGRTNSTDQN